MHPFGHMPAHLFYDHALDRTDIGEDRAGLQMRSNHFGQRRVCPQRGRQDHEIGVCDGGPKIGMKRIRKGQLFGAGAGLGARHIAGNVAGQIGAAARIGNGRSDQADTDQSNFFEDGGVAHHLAMKAASASTTARFASSLPTVRRKHCGKS